MVQSCWFSMTLPCVRGISSWPFTPVCGLRALGDSNSLQPPCQEDPVDSPKLCSLLSSREKQWQSSTGQWPAVPPLGAPEVPAWSSCTDQQMPAHTNTHAYSPHTHSPTHTLTLAQVFPDGMLVPFSSLYISFVNSFYSKNLLLLRFF